MLLIDHARALEAWACPEGFSREIWILLDADQIEVRVYRRDLAFPVRVAIQIPDPSGEPGQAELARAFCALKAATIQLDILAERSGADALGDALAAGVRLVA